MILNNKRNCVDTNNIYTMGCINSKQYTKKRLKKNSNSNLLEKYNVILKKKKCKKKKIDKEKQQSILDVLLCRNKKVKQPILKPYDTNNPNITKRKRKTKIPLAMRQNIWIKHFDRVFEHKCFVSWCPRIITCFDFEVGHNIPECKGGKTDEQNLFPICHKCNGGMGSKYTIQEWSNKKFFTEL